ncbi:hypothetical protein N9J72_01430 [Candidatus Gracilibacteria bacterium]|nr:hypothetical protein [Candidatus Gracilibacteria bacterium]
MWILRFHLLQTKDYNKIARICKKYGFSPRQHSPIVFAKGLIIHETQKKSWRMIGRELGVNHIGLYKFHELARNSECLREIFHVFIESRMALYVGDNKHVEKDFLDNSREVLELTCRELGSIVKKKNV